MLESEESLHAMRQEHNIIKNRDQLYRTLKIISGSTVTVINFLSGQLSCLMLCDSSDSPDSPLFQLAIFLKKFPSFYFFEKVGNQGNHFSLPLLCFITYE